MNLKVDGGGGGGGNALEGGVPIVNTVKTLKFDKYWGGGHDPSAPMVAPPLPPSIP